MDKCPKCSLALRMGESWTQVEGDRSPDTPTKVYMAVNQYCANPQCENYGQTVETQRILMYEEPERE